MLVATASGLHRIGPGRERAVELEGRDVTALAADGEVLWGVADGRELLTRPASGPWRPVAEVPEGDVTCVAAGGGRVWLGHAGARLSVWREGALRSVPGFDDAPGRDRWYTPWGGPPDVRSIAAAGCEVAVNVHVGGVLRSADGGRTWEPDLPVDDDAHQVVALPDGRLAAPTGGRGLAVGGRGDWDHLTEGLHGTYCRAAALAGSTLLVSASTGPSSREAAVYRRPLEGEAPFERCREGLPERFDGNVDSHWLHAASGTAALVSPDGAVYVSGDDGSSWEHAASDLPRPRALLVTAD